MRLSRRNRETLRCAARVLVPPGGTIRWGADDLDVAARLAGRIDEWPPRPRRQMRAFLTAVELLPVVSERRPFSKLEAGRQCAFLEATYHHRRAWRRQIVSYLKQLIYMEFMSSPEIEAAIGYRHECLK